MTVYAGGMLLLAGPGLQPRHRDLAGALHATRATVLLPGRASPLPGELCVGWHRLEDATGDGDD